MFDKEAIKYITDLKHTPDENIVSIDNELFEVNNLGEVRQLHPTVGNLARETLQLSNLSSLVDYIKSDLDHELETKYLHIEDNLNVTLKSLLQEDGRREELVRATAKVPEFQFDRYHDSESFLISLNARFTENYDRDKLIAFAGNVKEENARQTSDDGFSQKTTVKRGIASAQEELVPNPVKLAPYRTFTEIEQMPSTFVFRMAEGPKFALFEADGGAWINDTILLIESYLVEHLVDEINEGKIVILS